MKLNIFATSFVLFLNVLTQAASPLPFVPQVDKDQYVSDVIKNEKGDPILVSDLDTAKKMCASVRGRVPSVSEFIYDSYRRKTGSYFETLVRGSSYFAPMGGTRDEVLSSQRFLKNLRVHTIFADDGSPEYYKTSFRDYNADVDAFAKYQVWTVDRIKTVQLMIDGKRSKYLGWETEVIVPVISYGSGGFLPYDEGDIAVRCALPKLRAAGPGVFPCREVSAFADVGTRCVTSKNAYAQRIRNAATGLLGWQDEADGNVYIDPLIPEIKDKNEFNHADWSRTCRKLSKGNTKVDLPTIDDLKNIESRGLREILNEYKTLWAATNKLLSYEPGYRDVFDPWFNIPDFLSQESTAPTARCKVR